MIQNEGPYIGTELNIWELAKVSSFYWIFALIDIIDIITLCDRRHIVHTLVGGGGQHGGFDALDFRKIKHHDGDAGKLGHYSL
jgi:hypothetical protein